MITENPRFSRYSLILPRISTVSSLDRSKSSNTNTTRFSSFAPIRGFILIKSTGFIDKAVSATFSVFFTTLLNIETTVFPTEIKPSSLLLPKNGEHSSIHLFFTTDLNSDMFPTPNKDIR